MQLYATVASERASKSQGGNQGISIRVQGAPPGVPTLLFIECAPPGDMDTLPVFRVAGGSYEVLRMIEESARDRAEEILEERTKGKK